MCIRIYPGGSLAGNDWSEASSTASQSRRGSAACPFPLAASLRCPAGRARAVRPLVARDVAPGASERAAPLGGVGSSLDRRFCRDDRADRLAPPFPSRPASHHAAASSAPNTNSRFIARKLRTFESLNDGSAPPVPARARTAGLGWCRLGRIRNVDRQEAIRGTNRQSVLASGFPPTEQRWNPPSSLLRSEGRRDWPYSTTSPVRMISQPSSVASTSELSIA